MIDFEARLERLAARPDVAAAVDYLRGEDERTLGVQIELSEIAAPPFLEADRARRTADLLGASGCSPVDIDETGNVVAVRSGKTERPPLVISAHLDTVFPAGTDVTVRREGQTLRGPGISDDGRGLAALVALSRSLDAAGLTTRVPLLLVATVGEEGAGDLRGVKGLFSDSGAGRGASGFVSLDGAGFEKVVSEGLGSRRYRVTVTGPGGHSWVDFGTPNPAHVLMELGSRLAALELDTEPKTTLTVARLGGGKSINAIPQEAWLECDLRCTAPEGLTALRERVERAIGEAGAEHPTLEIELETIGDRPGGVTPEDAPLVQAALAATRAVGREPFLAMSSTDANIPMTLGIPSVTLGCGGEAGKTHTTDEWYRNTAGPDGIVRALYTVLLVSETTGD